MCDGWIAIYNGKKVEIKNDGSVSGIYGAKQKAIEILRVPKSKQGMLAIAPAYEEDGEMSRNDNRKRVRNAAKCLECDEVIESTHRHDFVKCSCENLFVEPLSVRLGISGGFAGRSHSSLPVFGVVSLPA